jgi:hypothetical protein
MVSIPKNSRYCLFFSRTVGPMEQEDFMDDLAAVIANTIRKDKQTSTKNSTFTFFFPKKSQHLGTATFKLVLN